MVWVMGGSREAGQIGHGVGCGPGGGETRRQGPCPERGRGDRECGKGERVWLNSGQNGTVPLCVNRGAAPGGVDGWISKGGLMADPGY